MKNEKLTLSYLAVVGLIYVCTGIGWFVLGGAVTFRSTESASRLDHEVVSSWGPELRQEHPAAWYFPEARGPDGREPIALGVSRVDVRLDYEPVKKGLLWYRTYNTQFRASYEIRNPSMAEQTVHVAFKLPSADASYNQFTFELEGADEREAIPQNGLITQAVIVPGKDSVSLQVTYHTRGINRWGYDFRGAPRIQDFELGMHTSFTDVDFAEASPTSRELLDGAEMRMLWEYPDVIGAKSITMEMPKVLNAGPVASRISFYAPVSLLFFFAVLLILGAVTGMNLHPMNYFFLAAGCFAFQLLFAYTVDVLPIMVCFIISSMVSLGLVCGYLHAVAGWQLTHIALPAQFAYMVLFSYSFFFDGLSGLTIAIGSVLTLAVLMITTAKTDWSTVFVSRRRPVAQVDLQS